MSVKFSNNAVTTLTTGISVGATSFTVASASLFPALAGGDWTYVTIGSEVIKITAISGTTFTCDATSNSHSTGDNVELRMTAELLNDFAEDTEALPLAGGALTGAVTTNSTFDGRDVSTDGAKLDTVATSANNYTHPANHAISVITGLQTALDGKVDDSQVLTDVPSGAVFTDTETTTTLSLATNILSYVDELGATTNLDLSLYLDDTNLAYIASGALNGSTGIATFTRSDASTFTVDLSALLDDTSVTVNNTLTSTSTTEALSANQGKVLKGLADGLETRVALNDAKVSNVAHPLVETAVPTGAVFTDTDTVYTHPNHSGDVTSTADGATVISSGAVDIAMLSATGTASGTTFLRGDNTWGVPTDTDTNTTYTSSDFAHDDLTGFVANEHIDWTADQGATNIHTGNYTDTNTTYTAGTGMSLSGTTFNCNINTPAEVGLGNLSSSGNALSGSFTATGNITAYSDLRLKTEIETIAGALEKVSDIRGVTFTMNDERGTGVIAQELEMVLPEAVRNNEDGMKSVAYGNITGLLIEAIKELSAKVEELENK